MSTRKWTGADVVLTTANILGVIAIVMIAAVIGTDRWLLITVNRELLSPGDKNSTATSVEALFYHTRQRGMFRECYPGSDTVFLDTAKDVVDKNCFMIKHVDNISDASDKYKLKVGLYMAFMVMFILGVVVLIFAYIIGIFLCVGKIEKYAWFAALLSFFAAFLFTFGMALFHGSWYVEKEQVLDTLPGRQHFFQRWPPALQQATTVEYGESYIVAWVGIGLVLITCICYIIVARLLPKPKKESKEAIGQDNLAYGYPPPQQMMYAPEQTQQPIVYYMA